MYESLLKNTAEYQKISASLAAPGPAALFGLPPAGRALLYAALQKDLGRVLCIVTPGEAEATHFADDLKALGLTAAVFPPRDFMLRPVEGQHLVVITLFLCHIHSPLRERLIRETPRLVPRSITSKSRSGKTGAAFAILRVRPPVWPGTHCCVFYQTSLKSASTTPSSLGFCWLFAPASGPGCAPAACCAAAAA